LLGEFVRALFDQQCLSCHGPERQLGGFRIDRRDDVVGTGERTPWVVPGDDASSPLLSIVSGARPDMRMAHRHTLSDENVALVRMDQSRHPLARSPGGKVGGPAGVRVAV
jgi:mono/diheme cytochrome c family protein